MNERMNEWIISFMNYSCQIKRPGMQSVFQIIPNVVKGDEVGAWFQLLYKVL